MQQPPNPTQRIQRIPVAGAPRTGAELEALMRQRGELGRQLESTTERRREVAEQLRQSDLTARSDLQGRLKALDDRSARLEKEIMQADDGIADAVARGVVVEQRRNAAEQLIQRAMTEVPSRRPNVGNAVAQAIAAEAVIFVLLGLVFWRFMWKPALAKVARPTSDKSRFDQLQQAVDVIAVEVERISENQRYVTKVLNEKLQPAVGAGEAQPISVKGKSAVPVRASDDA